MSRICPWCAHATVVAFSEEGLARALVHHLEDCPGEQTDEERFRRFVPPVPTPPRREYLPQPDAIPCVGVRLGHRAEVSMTVNLGSVVLGCISVCTDLTP